MRPLSFLLTGLLFFMSCTNEPAAVEVREPDAISFFGQPLYSPDPSPELLERYEEKKTIYEADPSNVENLIWFGRFTAYVGDYPEAIRIYTEGIRQYPNEARLYRHRGHRLISAHKIKEAIADLEKASALIQDQPNHIEPDGMPNAQNTPVSTLHGNIWYHLGLAYYLDHDMENALRGFSNGLATSNNDDNVVSTTHWIYMINRRLGREEDARRALDGISVEMNIIENFSYHQLDLFYKGELSEEDLSGEGSAGDAILYGIANWHYYNGHLDLAREKLEMILQGPSWASFGAIAAESDLATLFD